MSSTADNSAFSFSDLSKASNSAASPQGSSASCSMDSMYRSLHSFWTERRPSWVTSWQQFDNSKLNDSYLSTYGSLNFP
ncbi:hypothetical protein L596_004060 [Steinernema carpocapsae]|uniref:Uncharacterized protein n=1 Tax=Steinernema carpocapsae TaxID=34508 RepID=A0A4U8UYP1_STECR|nr:hypothetical protein L596_004060 [Steinernema carpocapsae]